MSHSKEKNNLTDVPRPPRNPKCARCRNHGFIVPQKGHMRKCPFADCTCWKCSLITQRTKIMALQRRNKKSQKGELACSESRVGPSASGCEAAVDGTLTVPGEGAQPQYTCGPMTPDSGGVREESGVKMLERRFQDADGKTYALLQDASIHEKSPREEGATGPLSTPDLQRKPPPSGIEHTKGTQLGPAMHWTRAQDGPFGINLNPQNFSRFGQREVYNAREVVAVSAMGLPMRLFAHYPNSYAQCPAILVNMPAMPSGSYRDGPYGPLVFPNLQLGPGAMHYPSSSQPGPSVDGRGAFFVPPPPVHLAPCQEQLVLIQQPQPSLPGDREQGMDGQSLGKQGSDGNSQENDLTFSSQETM